MFYLLKRQDEKQFTPGDVVMVLADFSGIEAGAKGVITETYTEGVMVTWLRGEEKQSVAAIRSRLERGEDFPAAQGWLSDGFARDELEYLAVQTDKHPKLLQQ